MTLRQRLELRQSHALVMTPQLQLSIKLLTLSNLQLAEYVEVELEKNPLLERDEGENVVEPPEAQSSETFDEPLEAILAREDFGKADELDAERQDVYPEDAEPAPASRDVPLTEWASVRASPIEDGPFDGEFAQAPNLKDHLLAQLSMALVNPEQKLIAAALIDGIDEAGYLRTPTADVAAQLGTSEAAVAEALRVLQSFEPTGVAARDLAECLALQLRERDRLDPVMQVFLEHLDLVARRDISMLCTACGVDSEDVAEMIAEIRALAPKPGLVFASEPIQVVIPDVFVREGPENSWRVELNSGTLPRVLVNSRYYVTVFGAKGANDANYLTECLNNANWLTKSLDQRARTILKVASEIVHQQDGFLRHGVRHLRPLNLQTVADGTGMHESTVSRATSNKYISTPRGIFEMKYFFTTGVSHSGDQEAHSAEAVRDRIRELVEKEAPGNVLSDDRIVKLLTAAGVNIARRTVAKYRETMRISSSATRRKIKQNEVFIGRAGSAGIVVGEHSRRAHTRVQGPR